MENVTNFLESSTIHGLAYIATGRKNVKLFWTLVVIAGFTGACILIQTSFQSWADSPVKTTVETKPITEITFPKVTVCPPKNTYTDLNYDLVMTENMTLDNDTRQELTNYAVELMYDHLYDNIMKNMSKFEEKDRNYNWYHGYTKIELPYYEPWDDSIVNYYVFTGASSGSVITQYFGDKFDADKVDADLYYGVNVYPPDSVRYNPNVTLHLDVEKVSLLSRGEDTLLVDGTILRETHRTFNYTPPTRISYSIELHRLVRLADVKKQNLDIMPGFRVTWRYSGAEVEPRAKYYNEIDTMAFVRNYSYNFPFSVSIKFQ